MKIQIRKARLSFPHLFEPQAFGDEGRPTYQASLLLPETDPQLKLIEKAIEAVAQEKWGQKANGILKDLYKADKVCLHDGSSKSYDGYEGHVFITARSATRPTVVDRDRTPLTAADGRPYAGCYVNCFVDIYPQDSKFGKRINASLGGVQFHSDGEAFTGGRPVDPDEFDAIDPQIDPLFG